MLTPKLPYRNHTVFTDEETLVYQPNQPYLQYVNYSDWTDGHHHMMHCHSDIAEILLIIRGCARYSVGKHRYDVQQGDVILCNSGVLHDEFPRTNEPYHTICIGIKQLALPGLAPNQLISNNVTPVYHDPEQFYELSTMFFMMERHAAEKSPYYKELCQHLMLASLASLRQMIDSSKSNLPDLREDICTKVKDYIDSHYTEEISIDMLSRMFFISPYHLSHVFSKQTGYTIKQYILRRRIGESQTLLIADTKLNIQQISAKVGFDDASYYSRLFTKYVGMSPQKYRHFRTKDGDE